MIYLYTDLTKKGLSDYQIKKKVASKELYMIKKGAYSTSTDFNYLEYLAKKHPNAVFTLTTACYCYGLIKKNEPPYYVATKQKDRKILDENVKQIFMTDSLYKIGVSKITYQGFNILIYDLERLLVEVVRNKVNLDFDDYENIINSYKKLSKLLNKSKISEYVSHFKDKRIETRIINEIYESI